MRMTTLFLPERMIKELDFLVEQNFFPNRNEAIHMAIRDLLIKNNRWRTKKKNPTTASNGLLTRIEAFISPVRIDPKRCQGLPRH